MTLPPTTHQVEDARSSQGLQTIYATEVATGQQEYQLMVLLAAKSGS